MDRVEYELRKLVLMVGTQRAFIIMKDVEKAVCPPPTEELLSSPSDNGGKSSNVVHGVFGSRPGPRMKANGPSAVARELFAMDPNVTAAMIREHIQTRGLDIEAKTVQVEVSKLRTKARKAA